MAISCILANLRICGLSSRARESRDYSVMLPLLRLPDCPNIKARTLRTALITDSTKLTLEHSYFSNLVFWELELVLPCGILRRGMGLPSAIPSGSEIAGTGLGLRSLNLLTPPLALTTSSCPRLSPITQKRIKAWRNKKKDLLNWSLECKISN